MAQKQLLSENFLYELAKLCYYKKNIVEICKHHLDYSYFPIDLKELKKIFRSIYVQFESTNKLPSVGVTYQQYQNDLDTQEVLNKIKEIKVSEINIDAVVEELESFLKKERFFQLSKKVTELYNADKELEAIELMSKKSEEIVNFSIRENSSYFMQLFSGAEDFLEEARTNYESAKDKSYDKVPWSIDALDIMTEGGFDIKETALMIARSGTGKSTFAKHVGFFACIKGFNVLHFQLEGSKNEAYTKYLQVWTGSKFNELKRGVLSQVHEDSIKKTVKQMKSRLRDITIYSYETFDECTLVDIRKAIYDYKKVNGEFPDLVIIDSLDLTHPGNGIKYGASINDQKMKKQENCKRIKNLAVECDTRILVVDQANDLSPEKYNDPDFVITRHNATADKNIANAFSYLFTWNQTIDEEKTNTGRLFIDKLRHYKNQDKIIKIACAFDKGRFYDEKTTRTKIMGL